MLFVFKLNDKLKLYVDYQNLNVIIKKNHYSFFFISQLLNRFVNAKLYTKLNIKSAYNAFKIKKKMSEKQRFDIDTIILNIALCCSNWRMFQLISWITFMKFFANIYIFSWWCTWTIFWFFRSIKKNITNTYVSYLNDCDNTNCSLNWTNVWQLL